MLLNQSIFFRIFLFSFSLAALLTSTTLLFSGCQSSGEEAITPTLPPESQPKRLVSAQFLGEYSTTQIRERFRQTPQIGLFTQYGVKVYKIVYQTINVDNTPVQASGALLIPVVGKELPLLSLQHGTITDQKAAPSNYSSSSDTWSYGTVLASAGFAVAAPDYLGYGASAQVPHPYEHAGSLASASLDMLRAVREFSEQDTFALSDKLFLAGYSEGGYATMALHKLMEEKHADEFSVTASAPGAGAYDKTTFAKYILESSQPQDYINSYLWVLDTYNRVYNLNRPFSQLLNEPYASQVQKEGVRAMVNKNPQQLFTSAFRQGVLNNQDTALLKALGDNDIYDWKPAAPTLLLHGTADNFVPFFNSQRAYDAMRTKGATQVELRKIEGGNHFTSIASYTLQTFLFFGGFLEEGRD